MKKQPNCIDCKHYYVTWNTKRPRGCKFFEFESQSMPSQMVWQSTGQPCAEFTHKQKKGIEKKQDLSSDDLW